MLRNTSACEHFVEARGLKTLFPAYMRPSCLCLSKTKLDKGSSSEDDEHIMSIITSLLLRLGGEQHARLLSKFVENGFEKVDRLVELHEKYYSKMRDAVEDVDDDDDDDLTPEERRWGPDLCFY